MCHAKLDSVRLPQAENSGKASEDGESSQQDNQEGQPTDYTIQQRLLCTFFAVCILIFATNPAARHPFHVALADAVQFKSTSTDLLTLLKRIGATTANETLKRFVTTVGKRIEEEGPFAQFPPGCEAAFFTCSIDNADKMATLGLRRFGHETPDMHVTTMQLQCKKSIEVPVSERLTPPVRQQNSSKEQLTHEPGKSGSADRRAQTLSAGVQRQSDGTGIGTDTSATFLQPPSSIHLSQATSYQGPFANLRAAGVTSESVLELTAEEGKAVKELSLQLFGAILDRERTAKPGQERESLRDKLAS